MDSLPAEILVHILRFLPSQEARRFQRIHKRFAAVIAKYEVSTKVPVTLRIDFLSPETTIYVDYERYENRAYRSRTAALFTRGVTVHKSKDRFFATKFIKKENMYIGKFFDNFLTLVKIEKLKLGYIYHELSLDLFGTALKAANCQVKEIDFGECTYFLFLDTFKSDTAHPTVIFKRNRTIFALPHLFNAALFYKIIFLPEYRATFENLIGKMALVWQQNGNVPKGTIEFEDPVGQEIREIEEFFRQKYPNSRFVRESDGRTLIFEKTVVDGTKLIVTYCEE